MSGRDYLELLEALRGRTSLPESSRLRESFFNELRDASERHRAFGSSRQQRRDHLHDERDDDYRDRRQNGSRGNSSRRRHPIEEMRMRRDCGFNPYEDYHRKENSRERRETREPSRERWKKSTSPPPIPKFKIRSDRNYINIMDLFDKTERAQRKKG